MKAAHFVGDGAVELLDFSLKFLAGASDGRMAKDVNTPFVEEAVAANVIEMLFSVDHSQRIGRLYCACVAMNRLSSRSVRARINDEREIVSHNKAGVDEPGRRVAQTSDGIAAVREMHVPIIALQR